MKIAIKWCSVLCGFASAVVMAQGFPNKPVRIIVPFSAGSGSDVFARTLGPKFTETWGQQVVVENREGAGGAIGAQLVAKAAPDGYTLLLGATSWAVAPSLYAKPPYDAFRDFVPVGRIGSVPSVLVVHPALPVNDVKALIKLAKAQPGKLDYSSSGKGAPSHLFVEYFKAMAKVDIVEVPYKITAQVLTDVIGGQIVMNLPILAAGLPHVRAGRLKALAVTSAKRAGAAPEIPTLAESGGLPGYEAAQWQGFIAPAGTPADVVTKINAELNRALQLPDVKERIGNLGVDFAPTTPQQFAADIKTDVAKWDQLIKSLGIRLD
ncbi:MAG: tripartite tricarboxylate transporter substrate binding protein [Proteobacteria bacterium]|nr:tripartite tricarboxylate transporter substrate binding protein [Pseudomonadota bacterium]